jgi:thiol:disulfide interchange protein
MPGKKRSTSQLAQLLIVIGVILLAAVILALKERQGTQGSAPGSSLPEAQIDQALSHGEPTLAFFHSDHCDQCLIMIDIVDQVYPEYAQSVRLVDVNVYDPNNKALLRRVGLQYIPMLLFLDHNGNGKSVVGVMEADLLRQQLNTLAGE